MKLNSLEFFGGTTGICYSPGGRSVLEKHFLLVSEADKENYFSVGTSRITVNNVFNFLCMHDALHLKKFE